MSMTLCKAGVAPHIGLAQLLQVSVLADGGHPRCWLQSLLSAQQSAMIESSQRTAYAGSKLQLEWRQVA